MAALAVSGDVGDDEPPLLLDFKHRYGSVPVANTIGKNATWRDELEYFREKWLFAVLRCFE